MISLHKSELGRALTREAARVSESNRLLPLHDGRFSAYARQCLEEERADRALWAGQKFKHSKLRRLISRADYMAGRARRVSDPFFDRLTARLLADQAHALVNAHHSRFTPAQKV